ncbi:MAG: hypothetical protein ACOX6O_00270 [Christensenellales bacterium]
MKKQLFPILLILMMSLIAWSASGAQTATSNTGETVNLTLYADFSNGFPNGAIEHKQITLPVENEPVSQSLIALALADGLSEWTGLDFTLNNVSFPDDESIIVDWSKDSTLIAGMDNREWKEGFHFYDAVSLNWFMMDSLATTIKRNMEVTTVYYQSEGLPVTFPNPEDMATQGLPELPIDQPYEGSAFFLSRVGDKGEDGDWTNDQPIAEGVFTNSLLESVPEGSITPYEAASGLFNLVLKDKLSQGTDYSTEQPMFITCVDVINIDDEECYLLSVSGVFNTKAWEYAVGYNYDSQNVYLISETGNQLLGSLLDEQIAEGVFTNSLLESAPEGSITPYEAASGLYNLVLKDKLSQGTDYSTEQPMFITCVDVINIDGEECYLLSVIGEFNTKAWEYAVGYNYDSQNVYLISESGNQLLGSLLELGQGN